MGTKRDRWASSSDDESEKKPSKNECTKSTNQSKTKETKGKPQSSQSHDDDSVTLSFPLHNPLLQGCRSVYDTYERIERVSEGTYGVVWKTRDLATGTLTALKQIKFHAATDSYAAVTSNNVWKEGFPVTALREISVLLALQHEAIVSVKEMVVGDAPDKVFMVMEFFECDLKDALRKSSAGGPLAQSELKGILQQILTGTAYMHDKWYFHRDLKPSNILVKMSCTLPAASSSGGRIALADFGLARRYQDPAVNMTLPVVTLWYRAPELLFGESRYGPAIDMWSIGCIMGELIRSGCGNVNTDNEDYDDDCNAILKGQGEVDQIDQIFSLVGVPNETVWPSFQQLPNAGLLRWKAIPDTDILLRKKFPIASSTSSHQTFLDANGYRLLQQLLTLDPSQRITAAQALSHAYFTQGVAPQIPRFFASTSTD